MILSYNASLNKNPLSFIVQAPGRRCVLDLFTLERKIFKGGTLKVAIVAVWAFGSLRHKGFGSLIVCGLEADSFLH